MICNKRGTYSRLINTIIIYTRTIISYQHHHYLQYLLNHIEFYSIIITLTNIINNGTANVLQIAKSLITITTMTEKTCNKAY